MQVIKSVLVEKLEQDNFKLMNELNKKDLAIKVLRKKLFICESNLNELKQDHDFLLEALAWKNTSIVEVVKILQFH